MPEAGKECPGAMLSRCRRDEPVSEVLTTPPPLLPGTREGAGGVYVLEMRVSLVFARAPSVQRRVLLAQQIIHIGLEHYMFWCRDGRPWYERSFLVR